MKNYFKQTQRGFTLLELVVVIAVTGVLLVVAMPKILGTSTDARSVALGKAAESLAAAVAQNYVVRSTDNTKGVAVATCANAALTLQSGVIPSGYSLDTTTVATSAVGTTSTMSSTACTLSTTSTPTLTVSFAAFGIS